MSDTSVLYIIQQTLRDSSALPQVCGVDGAVPTFPEVKTVELELNHNAAYADVSFDASCISVPNVIYETIPALNMPYNVCGCICSHNGINSKTRFPKARLGPKQPHDNSYMNVL